MCMQLGHDLSPLVPHLLILYCKLFHVYLFLIILSSTSSSQQFDIFYKNNGDDNKFYKRNLLFRILFIFGSSFVWCVGYISIKLGYFYLLKQFSQIYVEILFYYLASLHFIVLISSIKSLQSYCPLQSFLEKNEYS